MTISVGSFEDIVKALRNRGFLLLVDVKWIQQPNKIAGQWTCEVGI